MDQEFDKIVEDMDLVLVNTTVAWEHVTEIECGLRTVKESRRITVLLLPYKVLPKQVLIHHVHFAILWVNSAPSDRGVSDRFSPCKIVTHQELDYKKHCKGFLGEFIHAHGDSDVTKDMQPSTCQGLLLGPTSNIQGTYKVFDPNMGKVKEPKSSHEFPCQAI